MALSVQGCLTGGDCHLLAVELGRSRMLLGCCSSGTLSSHLEAWGAPLGHYLPCNMRYDAAPGIQIRANVIQRPLKPCDYRV